MLQLPIHTTQQVGNAERQKLSTYTRGADSVSWMFDRDSVLLMFSA